ncbi:MAG TPA: YigZ family protein [Bacteroides sp.]|nr:YigZ family protein [Bacteroides sp.]
MRDIYRTIASESSGIYKEKGSKFLAFAFPVETEKMIEERLGELRKQYHDARHQCYAWRMGPSMEHYRVNDDGEPSGSAGNPIFNQIQSRELTNVLVVVVRYFGGTLLGVGGLIRAYRTASAEALDRARIIQRKVYTRLRLNFGYGQMNSVMQLLKKYRLEPYDQQFDMECSLRVNVWKRQASRVVKSLSLIEGCSVAEESA